MFLIGILLAVPAIVFCIRWFSHHKFEYLEGVKATEQLDGDFWLCIGFSITAFVFLVLGGLNM